MPVNPLIDRGALQAAGVKYGNRLNTPVQKTYKVRFSATLAEINAGKTILKTRPDQMVITNFLLLVTGAFATATDIRLSDLGSGPVDIATIPIAQATNGAKLVPENTNITLGAGFNAPLATPNGLQIRKTGPTATGGTSVAGWIEFMFAAPIL